MPGAAGFVVAARLSPIIAFFTLEAFLVCAYHQWLQVGSAVSCMRSSQLLALGYTAPQAGQMPCTRQPALQVDSCVEPVVLLEDDVTDVYWDAMQPDGAPRFWDSSSIAYYQVQRSACHTHSSALAGSPRSDDVRLDVCADAEPDILRAGPPPGVSHQLCVLALVGGTNGALVL